jgi:seryl-tRNA synthetase
MLDIKFIRENRDIIAAGAKKKHITFNVEKLLEIDDERRQALSAIEVKRAEQNAMGEKIAAIMSTSTNSTDANAKLELEKDRQKMITDMKTLKTGLQKKEEAFKEVMKKWQTLMLQVPNVPDMTVPEGKDDSENMEVRTWGDIPDFSKANPPFSPKSHIDLAESLSLADFEKGASVAGFRGYFLQNDGFTLTFALWQFVFDYFVKVKKYTPMLVPSLVRRETLLGTGYLPQGEEDLYKTQDGDYLAGTGEVAAMSYFADQTLPKEKLPIKIIAFSPCFRREAGAHGKDTKGLMRVHEFFKFEQVIICEASHEESVKFHEEITKNAEEIMQLLKIPYHVVANCGGDLGLGQVKKYDIEAWIPSEGKYRETHSASYFHDFQTRRLNIRYKDGDGKEGKESKVRFAHSLNCTALPTPRPLIALLENYQQADGSVAVPEVLQKYLGKNVITKP